MSEMKPCPFCKTGGLSFGNDMGRGVVQCHDCNAYIVADSGDEAITLWNTRADLLPTLSAAMELPEVRALVDAARYLEEAAWGYGSTFESSFHSTVHDKLSDVLIPFVLTESDLAAIKEPKP